MISDSLPVQVQHPAAPQDAFPLARLNLLLNEADEATQAYSSRMGDPARVDTPILALLNDRAIEFANLLLVQQIFYTELYAKETELFVVEGDRLLSVGSRSEAFAEQLARQTDPEEIGILTDMTNQTALGLYRECGYAHNAMALGISLCEEV